MERFLRYMRDAWLITQSLYVTKKRSTINLALGNVSGDMDSVIGAIMMGYYYTFKEGFYTEDEKETDVEALDDERLSKFFVPVLNMNNTDLEARSDIIYHLEQSSINRSELVSIDMLDLEYFANENKLGVNLVDHNYPDCNQEFLIPHIERIIDHHTEIEVEYPKLKYKNIRFCGAAATLVTQLLFEDEELKDTILDARVAFICAAPILIDTVNFKEKQRGKKWDQVDEDVYKLVKEYADSIIPEDYFKTLYFKKTDEQLNFDLGWYLVARKDYKNYKVKSGAMVGISTVFVDIRSCEKHFGADLMVEEFNKIMDERHLDIYMILTHYNDGEVRRQIVTYTRNQEYNEKLVDLWTNIKEMNTERIEVGELTNKENVSIWQNQSTDYSRKKMEPFFREL